eukprot:TRINITY_DN396_c0_g2_i2.p1 TRINITY_DN396_c0_g2~~TRINITY_DN396_c0_g2_i2.p1  ORF type:complete len:182 (+),score=70.35 TRINITY_DN396_c0_g2_i2:70-615(+)
MAFRSDEGRMIAIKGMPTTAEWQELKDFLKKSVEVEFVEVILDDYGSSSGVGFARLKSSDAVWKAISELDQSNMGGSFVTVSEWEGPPPPSQKGGKGGKGGKGAGSFGKGGPPMWGGWGDAWGAGPYGKGGFGGFGKDMGKGGFGGFGGKGGFGKGGGFGKDMGKGGFGGFGGKGGFGKGG